MPYTIHTFMMTHWQIKIRTMLTIYDSPKVAITLKSQFCTWLLGVWWLEMHVWNISHPNCSQNLQFDRCPTLALCPITWFFDRIGVFFASQKEKYWAYSSSSFSTYSLLCRVSVPLGSDGVLVFASGRLRGKKNKTSVKMTVRKTHINAVPHMYRHTDTMYNQIHKRRSQRTCISWLWVVPVSECNQGNRLCSRQYMPNKRYRTDTYTHIFVVFRGFYMLDPLRLPALCSKMVNCEGICEDMCGWLDITRLL